MRHWKILMALASDGDEDATMLNAEIDDDSLDDTLLLAALHHATEELAKRLIADHRARLLSDNSSVIN